MKSLPSGAKFLKKTPEFTESTVPEGLLKDHQTKEGLWGRIVVNEGRLEYSISEPLEVLVLDIENTGIIEPAVSHHVRPVGVVRFCVEFYEA